MQAEGKNPALPVTAGGAKGSLGLCLGCQGDFPVALCQVQGGDEPGYPQTLYQVIHSGKVAVKLGDLVKLQVLAKAGARVRLRDHPDGAGPETGGLLDNSIP